MPKIVTIYPKVDLYSPELDQWIETTPTSDPNQYNASVMLPPNDTDEDQIYSFEAFVTKGDDPQEATGLIVYIIVGYETIYEYKELFCVHVDKDLLDHTGGEVNFTLSFGDCRTEFELCPPSIRLINKLELMVQPNSSHISHNGDIYVICLNNEGLEDIYKYNNGSSFDIIGTASHCYTIMATSNNDMYFLCQKPETFDPLLLHVRNNIVTEIDLGEADSSIIYANHKWFEASNGDIYLYSYEGSEYLYYINPNALTLTKVEDDLESCMITETTQGVYYHNYKHYNGYGIYKLNGSSSTLISDNDVTVYSIFESSSNDVYVCDEIYGVYKLISNNFTNILTLSDEGIFFENNENVYMLSVSFGAVYKVSGSVTLIDDTIRPYSKNIITVNDITYLYSEDVYKLTNNILTKIYSDNIEIKKLYVHPNGTDIYLSYTYGPSGIIHINANTNTITTITTTEYDDEGDFYDIFFTASNGDTFVTVSVKGKYFSRPGIYKLSGATAVSVFPSNTLGFNRFEEINNVIGVSGDRGTGYYKYNPLTETFEKDNNIDSDYSSAPIGPCTHMNSWNIFDYSKFWFNKKLLIQLSISHMRIWDCAGTYNSDMIFCYSNELDKFVLIKKHQ